MNGDRNAFLYTGSQAMHADKLLIFEPENSWLRKAGAGTPSNSLIAITRRYNNLVRDNDRQAQIELFLGLNPDKHFNCQAVGAVESQTVKGPLLYMSGQQLPKDFPDTDDEECPSDQPQGAIQTAQGSVDLSLNPSLSEPVNRVSTQDGGASLGFDPDGGGFVVNPLMAGRPAAGSVSGGPGQTGPQQASVIDRGVPCDGSDDQPVTGQLAHQDQFQGLQDGLREVSADLSPLEMR